MKEFWQALTSDKKVTLAIIVAALGYFVDVYDLVLFSVLRVDSLKSLGLEGDALMSQGAFLLNAQLVGFLVGGILWGVVGDKVGRIQVLFGSILLYSAANIANAFVVNVDQYALCRFLAGIGLAGEIGAGITLVSELMPRKWRGYGTTVVATVGVLGGAVAGLTGNMLHWQTAYIVGGCMGLALLVLRLSVHESGLFNALKEKHTAVVRGDIRMLLFSRERFMRFLSCILIGAPTWFAVGVLITFAPEIAKALGIEETLKVAIVLPCFYLGLTVGDLASGLLSQKWQSRKRVIRLCLIAAAAIVVLMLNIPGLTARGYYFFSFLLGVPLGFWVLMLTTAAEQFGTNLRATVATAVPNLVRATAVLSTTSFIALKPAVGVVDSALIVAVGAFLAAFAALTLLRETFGADLDFIETDVKKAAAPERI